MDFDAGDEVLMGMSIQNVQSTRGGFEVLTPGMRLMLEDKGQLKVEQRIGVERKVLSCKLPDHLSPWKVSGKTRFRCTFQGKGLELTVQGDSVMIFSPRQHLKLTFNGHFSPHYCQEINGNRLLLDPLGGCGFFSIPMRRTEATGLGSESWMVQAHLARWDELWVSICPPREIDLKRFSEPVAHEGTREEPYPSNEIIRSDAKYCRVFTIHEGWAADAPEWVEDPPGSDYKHPKPWETDHPVPADPTEFARVREEARRNGMKFLVYFSPYYSNAPDLFSEMRRILKEYKVDGLYFDGWCGHREDFRPGYYLIRRARAILGNRLLYLHSSTEPFGTCRVYLPFVHAYADYVLRGEAGREGLEREEFLRYTVSGNQIHNAVGLWCYYGSTGLPGYHNVVPTSDDIDAALRNHVQIWRTSQAWSKTPEELERFDREYYGKLAGIDLNKLRRTGSDSRV